MFCLLILVFKFLKYSFISGHSSHTHTHTHPSGVHHFFEGKENQVSISTLARSMTQPDKCGWVGSLEKMTAHLGGCFTLPMTTKPWELNPIRPIAGVLSCVANAFWCLRDWRSILTSCGGFLTYGLRPVPGWDHVSPLSPPSAAASVVGHWRGDGFPGMHFSGCGHYYFCCQVPGPEASCQGFGWRKEDSTPSLEALLSGDGERWELGGGEKKEECSETQTKWGSGAGGR